jgi:hypothetical protein
MLLILLNSLFLACNDYSFRLPGGEKSWRNAIVEESEIFFLVLFTIECLIKVVALGFVVGKTTYCHDGWNLLDFTVVATGWLGYLPNVANLTALRTIRVLRPLRSIKRVKEIKILINSLINSMPGLGNVAIFLVFMMVVFGIIGVSFMKGALY